MADISSIEKMKLEKLLQMNGGYVLDFSNDSFQRFIYENSGIDIYNDRYLEFGNSKANRLRCFWKKESNQTVSKILLSLLEYGTFRGFTEGEESSKLLGECEKIAVNMSKLKGNEIDNLNIIDDDNFKVLSLAIRESILKGQAVLALDRLHTYMVRYVRKLCDKHNIEYINSEPLNSCYGKYVKKIISEGLIESEMTKTILKTGVSFLDKFNYVRNNKSYAHDNEVLNNEESMFIYKSIVNIIDFIESIEQKNQQIEYEEGILW